MSQHQQSTPARPRGPRPARASAPGQPTRYSERRPQRPAAEAAAGSAQMAADDTVTEPQQGRPFAELGLPEVLVAELARQGKIDAFPIQAATLTDSLAGRDVLGRGATGSGKTLAFSLPLVARLLASGGRTRPSAPRALVLVPTRELANQVAAVLEPLAKAAGLRTTVVFGGVAQSRQETALRSGVDILVACPGRLDDLMKQRVCNLGDVQVSVLDEADHMADLGFLPVVRRILDATPARGQRLLFSATLDNGVDVLVKRFLTDPRVHAVAPAAAPVETMEHHVLEVATDDKGAVVRELASGTGRRVLFTRTKHQAKKLAKQLTAAGIPAVDLHGNLAQNARERNLAAFSDGSVKVLVATDIAARGIHVDDIELVVHVDPPAEHKAYLHRSGRTARAGASGAVVTVMLPEQRSDVAQLTRQAKISPRMHKVRPGDAAIAGLVGDVAAVIMPTAPAYEVPAQAARAPRAPRAPRAATPSRTGAATPARYTTSSRPAGSGAAAPSRTAAGFSGSAGSAGRGPRRSTRGGGGTAGR